MSEAEGNCDVCGRQGTVRICASRAGPVSLAYCSACIDNNAESVEIICAKMFASGGLDIFDPDSLKGVMTFAESAYQPLTYAIQQYPELEDEIREAFFG